MIGNYPNYQIEEEKAKKHNEQRTTLIDFHQAIQQNFPKLDNKNFQIHLSYYEKNGEGAYDILL